MTKPRVPLEERQRRCAYLGALARSLALNEIDAYEILELVGEEVWRSMQWWGRPDSRGDHVRSCTCGDCS